MRLTTLALIPSFLILTLSTLAVIHAQDATPPAPASVEVPGIHIQTLHVTTREVIVDVIVTDDKGNPVHGLTQSDFSISENGHPQTIRSFGEVSSATPIAEAPAPVLPRGIYTNSQSTPANGPVDIFLLDALNCTIAQLCDVSDANHMLKAVSDYVSSMPQGNKVAIFWLSESGLHMMQGFSSDPATLTRALHSTTIDIGSNQERHTTNWYTIDGLNEIAAYVAGVKGRKNLLWITPGMPVELMRDGGYSWGMNDAGRPTEIDMGMVHRLMDVYERFTAEQVAVSPIDPTGVKACATCNLGIAQLKVEAVAEQTGGEAFYNTNDLKTAITKAIDDQSQFYTLSYIPPNQKDDSHYHTIKVQVDQPKLHLVYREGYNAERVPTLDAPAPGPQLLKASIDGNTPARTQFLFDLGVIPTPPDLPAAAQSGKPPKSKTIPYDIYFGFPTSQIALLEDPDGTLHGSLEFDAAAYNSDRKVVARFTQTVPISLSPADYDDFIHSPYRFHRHLDLPPGALSLHVGILDTISNKVGTLEISVIATKLQPQNPTPRPQSAPTPCPPRCPVPSQ